MTLSIETRARIAAQNWIDGLGLFHYPEALALALVDDTFACWIEDDIRLTLELDDDEEFPMSADERAEYAREFRRVALSERDHILAEIIADHIDAN